MPNDTGVRKIDDANAPGGYREICVTPEAWDRRRKECCDRARATCENPGCRRFAPFKSTDDADAGDAHHLTKRKVRNDRLCNLRWLCRWCHSRAHTPAKVLPASKWRKELKENERNQRFHAERNQRLEAERRQNAAPAETGGRLDDLRRGLPDLLTPPGDT